MFIKWAWVCVLLVLLVSCGSDTQVGKSQPTMEKPLIYTSFYPLTFLVESLLGDHVEVKTLVPAGAESHQFEPSLADRSKMQEAQFVILNGLGMEGYAQGVSQDLGTGKVIMLSEKLDDLLEHHEHDGSDHEEEHGDHRGDLQEQEHHEEDHHNHGPTDPHTWVSPKQYSQMATILAGIFTQAGFVVDTTILSELKALDTDFQMTLGKCKNPTILTSHEAFGYMARDYGFEALGVYGIIPDQEPSASDIKEILKLIEQKQIHTFFTEPLISPKFTSVLETEAKVKISQLNPVESLTLDEIASGENYLTLMRKNLKALSLGLECE